MRFHAIWLPLFFSTIAAAQCTQNVNTYTCPAANGQLTVPTTVGAANVYPSTINFPTSGSIAKVTLKLNKLNGGNVGNIQALLVGPGSQRLMVFDAICSNVGSVSNATLTLDDAGASSLPSTATACSSVVTGTFKPTNNFGSDTMPSPINSVPLTDSPGPTGSATFASKFTGSASGNWNLYVANACANCGATPTLGDASTPPWTLVITLSAATPSTTTVSGSPNPSFTTTSPVTLTANVTSTSTVNGGVVTFQDNGVNISCSGGNQTVASGVATCTRQFTTEGVHLVTANYPGNGTFGSSSGTFNQTVKARTTNPQTNQFCNPGGLTFPGPTSGGNNGAPGSPHPSEITVSGISGLIQNVQVQLNSFTDTRNDADGFLLVGPNGKTLQFLNLRPDAGGVGSISNANIVIDDNAASIVPSNSPLTAGSWKPSAYAITNGTNYCTSSPCDGATLTAVAPSVFDSAAPLGSKTLTNQFGGATPNGTWQLFTVHRLAGNTGTVGNWCVNFSITAGTATTTTVTSSANPAFTGGPANSVVLTATVRNAGDSSLITVGTVTFSENGVNIGSAINVVNGVATVNVGTLGEGAHNITAQYSGTASFGPSSGTITQTMDNPSTKSVSTNVFTYCNPGQVTIPVGGQTAPLQGPAFPYPSHIFTTDLPGQTTKATLSLNTFSENFPQGLASLVAGPSGANLDFLSNAGGVTAVSGLNLVFDDTAASSIGSPMTSGTFKPTSISPGTTFVAPAPGVVTRAAPLGSGTLAQFQNVNNAGTWSLYMQTSINGAFGATNWCVNLTQTLPVVTITKTHSPTNFLRGSTGAYTIGLSNAGPGPTGGTVTVTDTLPTGLTPSSTSGTGWSCNIVTQTVTCTSTSSVAASAAYPNLTINVNVASNIAANSLNNTASVTGFFGAASTLSATDPTPIIGNDVSITKSHTGNFTQGQSGVQYTITVRNNGPGSTTGSVQVTDNIPGGLTATAFSGSGWTCDPIPALHCSRSDALAANTNYPTITLTANVSNSATSFTNQAVVTYTNQIGTNTTANDATTIIPAPVLSVTKGHTGNFTQGQTGTWTFTVSNTAANTSTTSGTLTLTDTLPSGYTLSSFSGTGWSCTGTTSVTCTSTTAVVGGQSYPTLSLVVNVPANSPTSVSNSASVSGGGSLGGSVGSNSDSVTVNQVAASITISGGDNQSANVGSAFATALQVTVRDAASVVIPGVTVTFTAPGSGASGTFSSSGTNVGTAPTNASGIATASTFTANGTAGGPYSVVASVSGLGSTVSFSLTNVSTTVQVTVGTSPAGLSFSIDGTPFTSAQVVTWTIGSNHTIATTTPQAGAVGTQYAFQNWSDAGALSHTVTAAAATTSYTANFNTQYLLTTAVSPVSSGSVSGGGYYNSGAVANITATPNSGFSFVNWTGPVAASGSASTTVTMSAPTTVTANFSSTTVQVTVGTSPAGLAFSIDGTPFTSAQVVTWTIGSNHTIATTTPQAGAVGTQYVFQNWSDAGAISHSVTAAAATTSYTASFQTQYLLTTAVSPVGAGTASGGGYYNAGAVANVTATPNSGFAFANWTGPVAAAGSASTTVTMSAPATVTANFTGTTVQVTVGTSPAGLAFSIDGTPFTSAQVVTWTLGSQHTIATTTPQAGGVGTQYAFLNWSDAGAISHLVTASAGTTSYTASFQTQYLLTTGVNPVGAGSATGGGYYNAGAVANVSATANSGYSFVNWTGPVASSGSANTTVTMSGPASVVANFSASGSTALGGSIGAKSGPRNARVWDVQMVNVGPNAATNVQISSFTLSQTLGTACTPVVSPLPGPVALIAAGSSASAPVTIDFSSCVGTVRFLTTVGLTANGGAATGTFSSYQLP